MLCTNKTDTGDTPMMHLMQHDAGEICLYIRWGFLVSGWNHGFAQLLINIDDPPKRGQKPVSVDPPEEGVWLFERAAVTAGAVAVSRSWRRIGSATYAKSHNANSSSIDSRRQEVGTALAACTTVHIVVGSGMRFFLRRNLQDLRASELVQCYCFHCYFAVHGCDGSPPNDWHPPLWWLPPAACVWDCRGGDLGYDV